MKDYLWLHLRELPYFRSLMRAVEARFYREIEFPGPVLDVGCGDGHFATIAFDHPLDVGLDPWEAPLQEAGERGSYRLLVRADGARMPFPDEFFASSLSNSVLEHIPHIDSVLAETARVLKPGAVFAFCVPNQNFLASLSISNWLDRIGLHPLADLYRAFFNRISRHYHCDTPGVWRDRLEKNGFEIDRWWHYYPPKALQVSEWGHYFGLPSLLIHKLTGRWIIVPSRWNLALTERLTRPYYEANPICENGVCTFYIARRKTCTST
jgi:SAM-dependent methyltransferase